MQVSRNIEQVKVTEIDYAKRITSLVKEALEGDPNPPDERSAITKKQAISAFLQVIDAEEVYETILYL